MMNKKGFTLVELMVVIVIIGVLAAVAIPKFSAATNKAKASEMPSVMSQIMSSQDVYITETNDYAGDAANGGANLVGGQDPATPGTPLTGAAATLETVLGVDASGAKYFNYNINSDNTAAVKQYTAIASVIVGFGKATNETLTCVRNSNNLGNTNTLGGANVPEFQNYIRSYYNNL